MKVLKVLVLMAVVALGVAGTAKANTGCCPSADCCADCSGCK